MPVEDTPCEDIITEFENAVAIVEGKSHIWIKYISLFDENFEKNVHLTRKGNFETCIHSQKPAKVTNKLDLSLNENFFLEDLCECPTKCYRNLLLFMSRLPPFYVPILVL